MVAKICWAALAWGFLLLAASGCQRTDTHRVQGYIEGEFVYVSSPLGGTLQELDVDRGDQVQVGQPLFALDDTPQKAAQDQSQRRVTQSRWNLEDAKKGKRPTEIESMEAQLRQAEAAQVLSDKELQRQEKLAPDASAQQDLDRARSQADQDRQHVKQLQADLETARLGSRQDQVEAAHSDLRALEAAKAQADWNLAQMKQSAPAAAQVFDTLYRVGEWVDAGHPIVVLLPPPNVKLRAFVSETQVSRIHQGDTVKVTIDGQPAPIAAKVSFVSPQAEYTPPVIYSRENRTKLVFMIEAVFEPAEAAKLHPGQPVDVELP